MVQRFVPSSFSSLSSSALVLVCAVFVQLLVSVAHGSTWTTIQKKHRFLKATSADLGQLAAQSDQERFRDILLQPMLRVRVSDTEGNRATQQHIRSVMSTLGWAIEEDSFQDRTPYGIRRFTNIVATQNPLSPRRLTFACHFDSKNFTEFEFIGATDSAVPCAMLLDLATTLHDWLFSPANKAIEDVSLQFIFFDGEEAQKAWTDTDSLYGSRHLAAKMQNNLVQVERDLVISELQTIDVLVLLDLIGTKNVQFVNSYSNTDRFFQRLNNIEKRLNTQELLSTRRVTYFPDTRVVGSFVADDHVPFVERGVPALHLIAAPFPSVWHTVNDNESCLDYATINDLNVILRVLTAEYLHLL